MDLKLKTQNLSKKELKNISEQVILQKSIEEGIDITSIESLTFVQYFKSDFFKKRFVLCKSFQKLNCLTTPLTCSGLNYSDNIIIFIDNFSKLIYLGSHQLVDLLRISYHELAHSHQEQKHYRYSIFESFNNDYLTKFIRKYNPNHYQRYHDDYLMERSADLFGINCTQVFLKQYPNLYQREKKYIERTKLQYEYHYQNFDFHFFWEEFYKIYQQNPELYQYENYVSVAFFKENSTLYRRIQNIKASGDLDWIGKELCFSIFTSPSFLKQLDFNNLEIDELETMIEAFEYMVGEAKKARDLNEKLQKKIGYPSLSLAKEREKIIAKINIFQTKAAMLKLHLYQKLEHSPNSQNKRI